MANWQQTYEQLKKKKKEIDNAGSKKEVNKINQKYSNNNVTTMEYRPSRDNVATKSVLPNTNFNSTPILFVEPFASKISSTILGTNENKVAPTVTADKKNEKKSVFSQTTDDDKNKEKEYSKIAKQEYGSLSRKDILKERENIQKAMEKLEKEGKKGTKNREWWDKEDGVFKNLGNVIYKSFLEKDTTNLSDEYTELLARYNVLSEMNENKYVDEKEYSDGVMGGVEKTLDSYVGGAKSGFKGIEATVQKALGQTPDEDITSLDLEEKLSQKAKTESSGVEKVVYDVAGGLGQMLPQMMTGSPTVAKGIGFANFGGGAYREAIRDGYTDEQATKYGVTIGALEMALSSALGTFSNVYGTSKLGGKSQELLGKLMPKIIGNGAVKHLLTQAGSEGIEEFIQEYAGNIAKDTLLDEKGFLKSTWENITDTDVLADALYSGLVGGITGATMSGPRPNNNINTETEGPTQQDIAPVQEQVNQQPTNPQETVQDIDNQIAVLEEQLMATESETEYERLSNQIRELEVRAEQIENGTLQPTIPIQENTVQNNENIPYQVASVEQTNQPTTQEVDSNLPVEVESNTQNIGNVEQTDINAGDVVQVANEQQTINEPKELKNSKIRNENGSLMKVYHGTPYGGFTEFKDSHMGSNDNGGYLGDGFYFTDNYDYAKSYTDEEFMDEYEIGNAEPGEYGNPQVYETYLNIQNPYVINESDTEYDTNTLADALGTETNYQATQLLKEQGYDGVIFNFESGTKEYLVFNSKQLKILDDTKNSQETTVDDNETPNNVENIQRTTPTQEELDNLEYTRKNKSGSEYASEYYALGNKYGTTNLYKALNNYKSTGKALDNDIAPIRHELAETTKELVKTIKDTTKEVTKLKKELNEVKTSVNEVLEESKALTEADLPMVEQEALNNMKSATDDMAPVREDTTPEYEFENDNEGSKTSVIDPMQDRTLEDVGNRKVKAYQYENPEVKPYFQEEARRMLNDLQNSVKGQRMPIYDETGSMTYTGTTRQTTQDIAALLDSQYNYSYADIENGLNAIIEDTNKVNTAVAKRIEFALNDRLINGYTDITGTEIPPNQDYVNLLRGKEYTSYYDSLQQSDIAPYEATSEKVSKTPQVKLKTDEDFTPNYEPLLEYMDNLEKRKQERKAMREEAKRVKATLEDTTPFREATKWEQAKLTLKTMFTNNKAVYDEIAKETGNNEIKFKADRINTISGETADITTAQLDNNLNPVGKSLNAIFENAESQGLEKAGQDFLYHLSNINRHKRNKGSANYSLQDSQKFVDDFRKQYPELANQLQTDNRNWNKNRKNNLIDAGFIDTKTAEFFEEIDADYVPFFEDREYIPTYTDVGEIKASQTVKRAKGGSKEVLPIKEAMIKQLMADKRAIAQNDLYKEVMKSYGKKAELGADVRLKATDMSDSLYADSNGDKYLTAYINGERKSVKVSNYMYDNIKQAETIENTIKNVEEQLSFIFKPLQAFSSYVRNIHTSWSPSFIITNPLKDIQDAPFNSKDAVKFAKNYKSSYTDVNYAKNVNKYAKEFKELTGQDITSIDSDKNLSSKAKSLYNNYQDGMLWNKFVAGYGSVKMYGDTYSNMDQVITKETQVKNKGKFKKMLEVVPNVNEFMELATRYAEFKTSIENRASLTEAFYNAKDVSTNFGRGGVITKALNRNGATFLNASVQGFSKFVRNFSGENGARGVVGSVAKAVTLGVLPAIFNHLFFGGDEEDEDYKALPDYIKDNYYLIKTDDGEFIRIPKGRALSVFGSAARRTLELIEGEKDAFDGYLDNAMSQSAPNNFLESNVFSPLIQAKNNETWYGGDLVPTRLQDKPVAEQYDESTDEFSKWLGQALNISPYKINYVIDQYTGGLGDLALPLITEEANSDGSFLAPLKDKFTANSTMDNKYAGQFYDKMDELEVISNGENATEEDQLRSQYMSAVSWEMSALYKEKREVQNDKSLTKAEKYERVKEIQKEINAISKNALETYDTGTFGEYYSSIGDYQFNKYINKNGEEAWGTLYEDEAEELNTLGLTNEEYNSYFAMKQEFTNLNNEYHNQKDELEETYDKDSDEYDLASDELYWNKKNTIIDSIMNSNFTNEQKAYIYNKYYDSKKNDVITTAGIDMNYLLDYDKNDFTADYNAKGDAIPNSRKNKVIEYVNEYDLSIAEKAIIIKSANTFKFNDYNYEIVDYVDKLDIPYEDKAYILKSLDMEVSDDGTISW